MPNFKLKNEDSENIKADCVDTVVLNLHHVNHWELFLGHPVLFQIFLLCPDISM